MFSARMEKRASVSDQSGTKSQSIVICEDKKRRPGENAGNVRSNCRAKCEGVGRSMNGVFYLRSGIIPGRSAELGTVQSCRGKGGEN